MFRRRENMCWEAERLCVEEGNCVLHVNKKVGSGHSQ